MSLPHLPGLVPGEDELRPNMRLLVSLRWFTALGLILTALVHRQHIGNSFNVAPLLLTGIAYLLMNICLSLMLSHSSPLIPLLAYLQVSFDILSFGVMFHFTGGVESPYIAYWILHLFGTALLLSRLASLGLVFAAAIVMGAIAWLEYKEYIPHIRLWDTTAPYQNAIYTEIVLLVFTLTTLLLFVLGIGLVSRLREQRRRAEALVQAAHVITSSLDVNNVIKHLLESCAKTLNATAGIVRLISQDGTTLSFVAEYGLSESYIGKGDVNIQDSIIDQHAVQGQSVIIEDVRTEARVMYKNSMLAEHLLSGLIAPIRGIDGRVLGVLRLYSDTPSHFSQDDIPFVEAITSQTGIALSHALQYQTLAETEIAKSRFVRTVTHELRAPVAGAQSLIRNLTQGYAGELTSLQSDILIRIENRLDFLQDLITDLLDLAAGKERRLQDLTCQPLDITDYLQRICDTFKDQARAKSITLESNADLLPSLWIRAHAEGLQRILSNLIGNAIKYTPENGSVSATLSWDDIWVELKISDTGIGIPEEDISHIFEEFFRAKNAREREKHSTGLGLAIVKQLVESFEGQITVSSTLGEGTTFIVHLPLLNIGEASAVAQIEA